MADTDKPSETATPEAPSNEATPATTTTSAPADTTSNVSDADVERLKKEADQKQMRINQLEKEAEERKKADEEAKRKQLEEDNNHKELFEQEKAKREALEAKQEEEERKTQLSEAKTKVLGDFNEDVKALAEEVGLELTDTDEASVEQFKGKLEKLSQRVSSEAKVAPNNPGQPSGKTELTQEQLREGLRTDKGFHDLVTERFPGIKAMTKKPNAS